MDTLGFILDIALIVVVIIVVLLGIEAMKPILAWKRERKVEKKMYPHGTPWYWR
jgi:hypothetical protein